jgi:hypothetical protein
MLHNYSIVGTSGSDLGTSSEKYFRFTAFSTGEIMKKRSRGYLRTDEAEINLKEPLKMNPVLQRFIQETLHLF